MGSMAFGMVSGNVGSDPEIRKTNNGEICSFSIAVNRVRGREEFTDWYKCVTFYDKLIDNIEQRVKKGMLVNVLGELAQDKWTDNQGLERVTFQITITKLNFDARGDGEPDRGRDRGRDDRGADRSRDGRDRDRGAAGGDRGYRNGNGDRGDRRADERDPPARGNGRDAGRDTGRDTGRDSGRGSWDPPRNGGARTPPERDLNDEIPF